MWGKSAEAMPAQRDKCGYARILAARHNEELRLEFFAGQGHKIHGKRDSGWRGIANVFRPTDRNLNSSALFNNGKFYDFATGESHSWLDFLIATGRAAGPGQAADMIIARFGERYE